MNTAAVPQGPDAKTLPGTVDRVQPCVGCSYNLQGLPAAGVCPECGLPVQDSLKGILLQYASVEYRTKIARGLSLVLNGILLQIIFTIAAMVAVFATGGNPLVTKLVGIAGVGVSLMLVAGYWFYTEPDPGYTGLEKPNSARQIARIAVLASAGVQVVQLVMSLMEPAVATAGAGSTGGVLVTGLTLLLSLAGLAAWATQFFAIVLYTRWIGSRIPDAWITNRSKTYMWLLPVLSTVGLLAVGLGPLVALVLYWNMLDRVRKHVKSINSTGSPAKLPGTTVG